MMVKSIVKANLTLRKIFGFPRTLDMSNPNETFVSVTSIGAKTITKEV
jgi:hypothetical protein